MPRRKTKESGLAWFKNWFGTKYYDLLYQHRDDEEAALFLDAILSEFHVPEGAKIIDIGCGQGRHAVYLAKKGFEVTGIDFSEENIAKARKRPAPNLDFMVHDMREKFPASGFDLAVNLFTSFGYFDSAEEDIKTLKNVHDTLKVDGLFIMDYLNSGAVKDNLVHQQSTNCNGVDFNITRCIRDRHVVKDILVRDEGQTYHYQENVKLLTLHDFEKYFDEAGFLIEKKFGNYHLEPYDHYSPRLIMAARKK